MAGLLLRDTPVITDDFIDYVTVSTSKVKNTISTASLRFDCEGLIA